MRCIFSGGDEGNLEYVLRYADKVGVRDMVGYVGIVSEEDLSCLYASAVGLVYSSAVGPDNLPPLEAMSLGCPVIAAEVPGAHEQLGNAALYFSPMSERELAERVKDLLGSTTLRERLVSDGWIRAKSWTVEDYANEVISIIDEFLIVARAWEKCDSVFT
jgi:glycosyltransferase involved in cell wall biosynthesis